MQLIKSFFSLFFLSVAIINVNYSQNTTTYQYDNLNRLTLVTYSNGTSVAYTYDAVGNRTSKTVTSTNYTITATANPTAGGTVTGAGTYGSGSSCTLRATANANYVFTNWTVGSTVVSTNAVYTFTVTANRTLKANFTRTYNITATASPTAGGTVSGGGT